MAMFNAFEGLTDTVGRIAAFPMAGEGVADYLIAKSLKAGTVPKWITEPYQKIHDDEEEHGNYPFEILVNTQRRLRSRRAPPAPWRSAWYCGDSTSIISIAGCTRAKVSSPGLFSPEENLRRSVG